MKSASIVIVSLFAMSVLGGCVDPEADANATGSAGIINATTSAGVGLKDAVPPGLLDLAVNDVTQTTAKLSWRVNEVSEAVTSLIEYDLESAPGFSQKSVARSGTGPKFAQLEDLRPGSLYKYRLFGYDALRNNASSEVGVFTTLSVEDSTEPIISGVSVASVNLNAAALAWFVEDENATLESWITYGTQSADEVTSSSKFGRGTQQLSLNGLQSDTLYRFRVHAVDPRGNADESTERQFRTLRVPDTTPPAVSTLTATEITLSSVRFYWYVTDDSGGATSYLEWAEGSAYNATTKKVTYEKQNRTENRTGVGPQDHNLPGLKSGTKYYYRIHAEDGTGNELNTADQDFRTTEAAESIPPTITGISTFVKPTSAVISWTPDDNSGNVDSHLEYRRKLDGVPWSVRPALHEPGMKSDTIVQLIKLTTYEYRILASDFNNNHFQTPTFEFTTPEHTDATPPEITDFNIETAGLQTVTIRWTLTDDVPFGGRTRVMLGASTSSLQPYGETILGQGPKTMALTNLLTDTAYVIRLDAEDQAGIPKLSATKPFRTAEPPKDIVVTSTAWDEGEAIPEKHALKRSNCVAIAGFPQNAQPQLTVTGLPSNAGSWVILFWDEDAPSGQFMHWSVWNLPTAVTSIAENADVPAPGTEGAHGFGPDPELSPPLEATGYAGPCPDIPDDDHTYHMQVFAIAGQLYNPAGSSGGAIFSAIQGKILAWGELTGTYDIEL